LGLGEDSKTQMPVPKTRGVVPGPPPRGALGVARCRALGEAKPIDVHGFGLGMVLVFTATLGCNPHQETRFDSNAQLVSRRDVTLDAKRVVAADFELEWDPCPGDQYRYVRGSREFSACTSKYEKGDDLAVKVRRFWDTRGFYRWDVLSA
jgi:hypothetical protein